MTSICLTCAAVFPLYPEDLAFYQRMEVPPPRSCPPCRQIRRAAFRNSRNLYRGKCASTGKPIISLYSPDKPFTVYDAEVWWGDSWDGLDYGRDFDFTRPFFEQFAALMKAVPRPALFSKGSENSAYTNHAVYNKNCYMCFNAGYCVDTFHSGDVCVKCIDSCDLTNVLESELLYASVDCLTCHSSRYLLLSQECSDSAFLYDCRNCHHCFRCWNLRNQSYCIENKQYTKTEYLKRLSEIDLGSYTTAAAEAESFAVALSRHAYTPALISVQSEQVTGDYIFNSKNIFESFDVRDSEDLRYCSDAWDIRSSMDTFQTMDKAELSYETHASSVSVDAKFCNISHENHAITYTDLCFNSSNLFGCAGLKRKQFCIFNKRYSESEYAALKAKIVEHLHNTGEYGEFFPTALSPFGYNETVAQEFVPLTRAEALELGHTWSDFDLPVPDAAKTVEAAEIPDTIGDVPDDITNCAIRCTASGRLFRITTPELALYRKLLIPVPREHPDVRYAARVALRNLRAARVAACGDCAVEIETHTEPRQFAKVLCEACYLKRIH